MLTATLIVVLIIAAAQVLSYFLTMNRLDRLDKMTLAYRAETQLCSPVGGPLVSSESSTLPLVAAELPPLADPFAFGTPVQVPLPAVVRDGLARVMKLSDGEWAPHNFVREGTGEWQKALDTPGIALLRSDGSMDLGSQ